MLSIFRPSAKSVTLSQAFVMVFSNELGLFGTLKPPISQRLVKRETRIMRDPAMVMTAHRTDLMVTMIVHMVNTLIYVSESNWLIK